MNDRFPSDQIELENSRWVGCWSNKKEEQGKKKSDQTIAFGKDKMIGKSQRLVD